MSEERLGIGSRVYHSKFGKGVVVAANLSTYSVYFSTYDQAKEIPLGDDRMTVNALIEDTDTRLSLDEVKTVLSDVLRKWSDVTEVDEQLGERWQNGTLILKPGKENTQAKELPIDAFFHKIVMTRDRLRVMEQKINSSKNLDDEEKVALQQYITRIYGSLTTFNVLFAEKEDHFKGTGS